MLPALMSGNTNVLACPATLLSGHFVLATVGETAASNCNSPSIASSGYLSFALLAAERTLSTASPFPEPSVE